MLNNKELFLECLAHPAKNVDVVARETLNKVILPIDDSNSDELLDHNSKLIELITKYRDYKSNGDSTHNAEIISQIDECLKYDGMNFCPFSQYLMVHDVTYDMYLNKLTSDEKEYIINCYLEDRHELYLKKGYSDIIFQVLTDNYSHKRKGSLGGRKTKENLPFLEYRKNI